MIEELKSWINDAEAIVIGAGAGLSASAGFQYGGKTFLEHFKYMYDEYGYTDMYTAGFHSFKTESEKWAYWSKMIYLNRYKEGAKSLYKNLFELIKNKNYFVITTNVDHQFQLAGFDKKRLFYMQGDYGLFQCSNACHKKTYDNKESIKRMVKEQIKHQVPEELLPVCPICGAPMTTNLRCDDSFVEDEGWHLARRRYQQFIEENKNKRVLYLELGVGFSTPIWIKYPFIKLTYENKDAKYIVIDKGYCPVLEEIKDQTIIIKEDIDKVIDFISK